MRQQDADYIKTQFANHSIDELVESGFLVFYKLKEKFKIPLPKSPKKFYGCNLYSNDVMKNMWPLMLNFERLKATSPSDDTPFVNWLKDGNATLFHNSIRTSGHLRGLYDSTKGVMYLVPCNDTVLKKQKVLYSNITDFYLPSNQCAILLKHYYKHLDGIHNIASNVNYTIQNNMLVSNFVYDDKRLEVIRDIHNNNWKDAILNTIASNNNLIESLRSDYLSITLSPNEWLAVWNYAKTLNKDNLIKTFIIYQVQLIFLTSIFGFAYYQNNHEILWDNPVHYCPLSLRLITRNNQLFLQLHQRYRRFKRYESAVDELSNNLIFNEDLKTTVMNIHQRILKNCADTPVPDNIFINIDDSWRGYMSYEEALSYFIQVNFPEYAWIVSKPLTPDTAYLYSNKLLLSVKDNKGIQNDRLTDIKCLSKQLTNKSTNINLFQNKLMTNSVSKNVNTINLTSPMNEKHNLVKLLSNFKNTFYPIATKDYLYLNALQNPKGYSLTRLSLKKEDSTIDKNK